jgi:uncharacterized damage-inducible protein DinB
MTSIDEQGRPEMPLDGDEVPMLLGFLDYQRATLEWKCRGLTDEQLRSPLHPTSMTLGGLLMHLARVEDHWFSEVVSEQPALEPWASMEWAQEWAAFASQTGEQLRRTWQERVAASRAVVAAELDGAGVEGTHLAWGGQGRPSLRWVLLHMLEEYSRHNGHADLLREAVDGQTGE